MSTIKQIGLFLFAIVWMGLMIGCSGKNQPVDGLSDNVTQKIAVNAVDNELAVVNEQGVELTPAKGVFSIGWNKVVNRDTRNPEMKGHALAVGFKDTLHPAGPGSRGGVDLGSVYLNYGSSHLELQKRTGPHGGISYSTFSGPHEGENQTDVGFISNEKYEFEVTGSTDFTAFKSMVTAPPALLHITAPAESSTINSSNDLTVTWQGGYADGKMLLRIIPLLPPPPLGYHEGGGHPGGSQGPGGMGHGGGRGQGGGMMGPHDGENPMRPDSTKMIVIKLENNAGSCTIPASKLQGMMNNVDGKKLMISVSQVNVNEADHDGGKVHLVLRDEDMVVVNTQ